jgi:hypothetical protein
MRTVINLRVVVVLDTLILVVERLVAFFLDIHLFIDIRDRHNDAGVIKRIDPRRVAVVLELLSPCGREGRKRTDDRVNRPTRTSLIDGAIPVLHVFLLQATKLDVRGSDVGGCKLFVDALVEGDLRRHGFTRKRKSGLDVLSSVVDPGLEADVIDGTVGRWLPVYYFVAGGAQGFDDRFDRATDGGRGVHDAVCKQETKAELLCGFDLGFLVGAPRYLVNEWVVEPWVLLEESLGNEAQRGCVRGERTNNGENRVLTVHRVRHAFIWEAAGRRANTVESIEGGGNADRAANVSTKS